ncbi:hypothetical protein Aple_083960 [Acrocarpospora pleiomorpha]|uniref:Uncharacterized protein n=1 Tax=Acrocarpospora pleiomorpha TaxID=90975 RepID=A0A5M3XWH9_9ACTN|nr:hypothetical protein [Acrocarpospora pleiomorpha]GES25497.1 hypothetical protein Aple_083960 [Acrocarpospora pleiomorpha]
MSNKRRALAWASGAVFVLISTVVGVLLFKGGLEDADKWSSVIGMTVTVLIGVPLSLYQTVLARRALMSSTPTAGTHIAARGNRSIAGQNIGFASTGDGSFLVHETTSSAPSPAPQDDLAQRSDSAVSDPPAHVQIEASGERSIAAQNIGSASTGDALPTSTAG